MGASTPADPTDCAATLSPRQSTPPALIPLQIFAVHFQVQHQPTLWRSVEGVKDEARKAITRQRRLHGGVAWNEAVGGRRAVAWRKPVAAEIKYTAV